MIKNKKGFTLIELLVVIAIIGILSGLIIVNLSGAQNAAKDAKIKAMMDQLRTGAEVYKATTGAGAYNNSGGVLNLSACTATASSMLVDGGDVKKACDAAKAETAGAVVIQVTNGSTSPAYCAMITLNDSSTFCVDSTGYAGSSTLYDDCAAGDYTCADD